MKRNYSLLRAMCCLSLALFVCSAWAQIDEEEPKPWLEEKAEPWKEQGYKLPPYPREQDLAPLIASGLSLQHEYFIDLNSLSRGDDNVFRYTIVVSSASGARNIFHEGIRCLGGVAIQAPALVKIYAYGSSSGEFRPARTSEWRRLRGNGVYSYRRALADDFFCDAPMAYLDTRRMKLRFAGKDWSDGSGSTEEIER